MPDLDRAAATRPQPASADPESDDCVFLTCFNYEFNFLSTLLCHSGVRLRRAGTLEQADFLLTVTGATVVLCDAVFLDGSWSDCAEMLAHFHPQVSLLVLADEVDGPFVRDAVDRGACAVSWKPLCFQELRGLIRVAREASVDRMTLQANEASVR
jgi:DNA-binding NtrC family response regulator